MRATTSLCFIVWNEGPGCEIDLPKMDFTEFDEVFAIDGGSTDQTVDVLQKHGVAVHAQKRRSLNAAYWQAVETSTCEYVVIFFPKATLDVSVVKTMKRLLLEGHELVVASRLIPGARNEEDSHLFRPRKWGVKALAIFAALCWRGKGPVIWDVLHGVKGFRKQAFLDMDPSPTGVSIDLEMVIRAYRLGLQSCEFPVSESPRMFNETRFKILPTGIKLARCLWREFRRRPPVRRGPAAVGRLELERRGASHE